MSAAISTAARQRRTAAQSQAVDPARLGARERTERLLALAEHLAEPDRLLIEQVYRHGRPVAEVARLQGKPARTVQRRVGALLNRMRKPEFVYAATRLDLLPRELRAPAKRVILQGQPLRTAAKQTGLSLHRVRQAVQTVRDLATIAVPPSYSDR